MPGCINQRKPTHPNQPSSSYMVQVIFKTYIIGGASTFANICSITFWPIRDTPSLISITQQVPVMDGTIARASTATWVERIYQTTLMPLNFSTKIMELTQPM